MAEFQRMEQERKAAEAVAEDAENEDMTVLSWEENLAKEKQQMHAEAGAEASKEVGKLRVGSCWPCIKNNVPCVWERVSLIFVCLFCCLLTWIPSGANKVCNRCHGQKRRCTMMEEEAKKLGYKWSRKEKEEDEEEVEDRKRRRMGMEEVEWRREVRKTVERMERSVEKVRSEMMEMRKTMRSLESMMKVMKGMVEGLVASDTPALTDLEDTDAEGEKDEEMKEMEEMEEVVKEMKGVEDETMKE